MVWVRRHGLYVLVGAILLSLGLALHHAAWRAAVTAPGVCVQSLCVGMRPVALLVWTERRLSPGLPSHWTVSHTYAYGFDGGPSWHTEIATPCGGAMTIAYRSGDLLCVLAHVP